MGVTFNCRWCMAFLPVFGLSLGIAVSLLIALRIREDYNFDRFPTKLFNN